MTLIVLTNNRVLVACKVPKGSLELLKKSGLEPILAEDAIPAKLNDFNAILIRSNIKADSSFLARLKPGSLVIRLGAGLDNVDVATAEKLGLKVFNTPGSSATSVAEHIIGLMLALARNIPACSHRVKSGVWPKAECVGVELCGKTLGIVGYGCTGSELAKHARALDMKVIAYDKYKRVDSNVEGTSYEELLATSDFISYNVPLTQETKDMFNVENLAILKRGARIINASRGEVVSVEALLKGLHDGIVAGAALDVLPHEPPLTDSEKALLLDPRVIVTPHVAGSTEEAETRAVAMACDIIRRELLTSDEPKTLNS
ncbi:MAG: NAD(P)-dependent oxidoreductase [TACK group archaeon]|nr:NAD(P)-dependent oxidoreductase [TACK group archaeon]